MNFYHCSQVHFSRTGLVPRFPSELIHCAVDSIKCWKNQNHTDMAASQSHCRFVGSTFMMLIYHSTTLYGLLAINTGYNYSVASFCLCQIMTLPSECCSWSKDSQSKPNNFLQIIVIVHLQRSLLRSDFFDFFVHTATGHVTQYVLLFGPFYKNPSDICGIKSFQKDLVLSNLWKRLKIKTTAYPNNAKRKLITIWSYLKRHSA